MKSPIIPAPSSFLVFAALMLAPGNAQGQSDGCPWCTTPTTCAEVAENTDIGGCYNIGAGCEEIAGSCTIEITRLLDREWRALLGEHGLEFSVATHRL